MALRGMPGRSVIGAAFAVGVMLVNPAPGPATAAGGGGDAPGPSRSVPVKPGDGGPSGPMLADIGPAPEVLLVDTRGRPFRLSELKGKAVLVGFVYTTCTGVCPATTLAMSRVQESLKAAGLWGSKAAFVSISLDPERDTTEVLAGYAKIYGADPASWHFLTGPPGDVAKVVAAWGMWARPGPTGALDHPSRVFLVDPRGRRREIYSLDYLSPRAVVQDVRAVLAEAEADATPAGGR